MITRRNLLKTLGGVTALSANSHLWAAVHNAWENPIGLEIYTVRDLFEAMFQILHVIVFEAAELCARHQASVHDGSVIQFIG